MTVPRSDDWREGAACASDADPEAFFEPGRVDEAKRVCRSCPVREACLSWALAVPSLYGVAGGLTARERRGVRERSKAHGLRLLPESVA